MTTTYTIERKLGSGAIGQVYLLSSSDREPAVLKLPHPHHVDEIVPERLLDALRRAATVDHDGVVTPLGIAKAGGRRGVVSDLVEGADLYTLSPGGRLPSRVTLEIGARAAEALHAALTQTTDAGLTPLVHGDIKPTQILVTGAGTVHVTDWGVTASLKAEAMDGESTAMFSRLAFMPPEQLAQEVEDGDDVYSLGMVIYTMLAGARPSPALYIDAEQHKKRLAGQLEKLEASLAPQGEDIVAVLGKLLAYDRSARPNAAELAADFQRLADALVDEPTLEQWAAETVPGILTSQADLDLDNEPGLIGSEIELGSLEGEKRTGEQVAKPPSDAERKPRQTRKSIAAPVAIGAFGTVVVASLVFLVLGAMLVVFLSV